MTRSEFMNLLTKATTASVDFARRLVENELPQAVRFHVILNQSYDGNATAEERVYPEDDGREYLCLSAEEVGSVLLREGRCPEWVDVSVEAQSATDTRVQLLCCGRFTDNPRRMYYTDRDMGPFGIKSPVLPFGYKQGTRFRVPMVQPCASPNGGPAEPLGDSGLDGGPPSVS
jgi:hypothetical protein